MLKNCLWKARRMFKKWPENILTMSSRCSKCVHIMLKITHKIIIECLRVLTKFSGEILELLNVLYAKNDLEHVQKCLRMLESVWRIYKRFSRMWRYKLVIKCSRMISNMLEWDYKDSEHTLQYEDHKFQLQTL